MLDPSSVNPGWGFEPALELLRTQTDGLKDESNHDSPPTKSIPIPFASAIAGSLGDFSAVWEGLALFGRQPGSTAETNGQEIQLSTSVESEFGKLTKAVKWRDEQDGADLEDNVEPQQLTAAQLRTRKRAARRARARERELGTLLANQTAVESATDNESGEELESLRRKSPDRRALIADLLGRPRPTEVSPPTSPSPPKQHTTLNTTPKREKEKEWPVSNPFLWTPTPTQSSRSPSRPVITAIDGLSSLERKRKLISRLSKKPEFQSERKYLSNAGLLEPAFSPLNTSPIGVHVFIDMSNISIGFHDCLKGNRGMPISTFTKRIPMDFHNFSLILERGRPTAKRVLCGSDRSQAVVQAETVGYDTNILDRVHKAKTPPKSPRRKSHSGYHSSGLSYGETSGSETPAQNLNYKWSEQAVDEILHLHMSHSILDAEKPSTMILATGDAAEAEYSDGFLRMVERALSRGWQVELYSFKPNTSSLYRRPEFRNKWGPMFKWVPLDDFAEAMIFDDTL